MSEHIKIAARLPRCRYRANGVQRVFTFDFAVFRPEDVEIRIDGAAVAGGFSVAVGAAGTGAATLDAAPADGAVVTLSRRLVVRRETDFQEGGELRAKTLNDELDFQTAALQQVETAAARSLHLPVDDPDDAATQLPRAASRAGRALVFDTAGNPAVSNDIYVDQATASAASAASAASSAGAAGASAAAAASSAASASADAAKTASDRAVCATQLADTLVSAAHAASDAAAAFASAGDAASSATSCAASAAAAGTAATGAAASAASAANAATTASTQAGSASTSAANAAGSAGTAAGSASGAATQAANAAASAMAAAASATGAGTSSAAAANSAVAATSAASSVAVPWAFAAASAMADPGAGNFRFNAGTPAAASALAVSALTRDAGSPDLSDFVATWDDSTNPTGRGLLSLRKLGAPATFAVFVVQSVVDNGAWLQIAVTHLSSAGSWSAADTGVFAFARSGDKGLDGAGTVVGVSAGNASIAIGGTAANPTIAVAANGVSTARLAREGSAGQVLTSNGAAADPSYQPLPAGVPAGIVVPFAGSVEPAGWLFAAGQAVGRATYAALFAALGTAYGAGDGSTTFNLPDLRGRAAAGRDNMNGTAANRLTSGGAGIAGTTLGAAGGSETHVLTAAQMPAHTHSYVAGGGGMTVAASFGGNDTTAGTPGGGSTSGSAGSGAAHPNAQPTLVLNYIVKT